MDAFFPLGCSIKDASIPGRISQQKHMLPIEVYLNISSVVFFCVSQFCILICRLW